MNTRSIIGVMVVCLAAMTTSAFAADLTDQDRIERGRYLVKLGACNDCHTPGFPESDGTTPETEWFTGNPVGFSGPWGTTYPRNVRLFVQKLTEEQWLQTMREPKRPPMPWFALRDLSDDDLASIYHFLRSLGPKGVPEPAYIPPGETVSTPYIDFVPKNLPDLRAQR